MRDTKQAILSTALHLFAADGYEAVSVSQIAGALGMGKSALYKHYRNKRDIFDQIVAPMERMDAGADAGAIQRRHAGAAGPVQHGAVSLLDRG